MKYAMKAWQTRSVSALLFAFTLFFVVSCSEKSATLGPSFSAVTAPARITVEVSGDTLNALGDTLTLTATVYDSADNVLPTPVAWATSHVDRATVTDGFVTTTGRGRVNISARVGTVRGISTLLVRQVVETITVTPAAGDVTVGDTVRLTLAAADSNGAAVEGGRITWRSGNEAVATVDSTGLVTILSGGVVNIVGRISGRDIISTETGRARLVAAYPDGAFQISPANDTIRTIGSALQLTATALMDRGNPVPVAWKSLNPRIVSIDGGTGLATALSRGTARIVATAGDYADTTTLAVWLATDSVSVNPDTLLMSVGGMENVVGVQYDSAGTVFGKLDWLSRDTLIATVDTTGLVTAVAVGTVSIIGSRNGFSDSVVVIVSPADSTTHVWSAGVAGDWTDATKWTPGAVPAATDTANILVTDAAVSLTAATTISSMELAAGTSLLLSTFALSVTNDLIVDAAASMTGGNLILSGTGAVRGPIPTTQITGVRSLSGSVTVGGSLTIDNGGVLTIDTNALVIDNP